MKMLVFSFPDVSHFSLGPLCLCAGSSSQLLYTFSVIISQPTAPTGFFVAHCFLHMPFLSFPEPRTVASFFKIAQFLSRQPPPPSGASSAGCQLPSGPKLLH